MRSTSSSKGCAGWRLVLWSLIASGWLVASCGGSGKLIQRGDELSRAGLYEEALAEYEQAAEASPGDPDLDARILQTRKKLAETASDDGLAQMQTGDYLAALKAFKQAIEFDPNNPGHKQNLKKAALHRIGQGNKAIEKGQLDEAVAIFKSLISELPRLQPAKQGLADAQTGLAKRHLERARGFQSRGLHGNALIALTKLAKLIGAYGESASLDATSRAELKKASSFSFQVRPGKAKRKSVAATARLVQAAGQASVPGCSGQAPLADAPARLVVSVTVENLSFADEKTSTSGEQKYQSGTRPVDNPAYQELETKIAATKERIAELEKAIAEDNTLVEQFRQAFADAGPDDDEASLRTRLKKAEKTRADHQAELASKRDLVVELHSKLATTPRKLDEPVYDLRRYPIVEVKRTATVRVVVGARSDEGQLLVRNEVIEATASTADTTNKAQPRYGIKADPLAFAKSDEDLSGEALDAAAEKIGKLMGSQCERWQEQVLQRARQATGAAELEAIEDFVLYLFISPAVPPEDLVRFLRDKRGFDDIAALRGQQTK